MTPRWLALTALTLPAFACYSAPPPLKAWGDIKLTLPSGDVSEMAFAPGPGGPAFPPGPVPSDLESVTEGQLVGSCTVVEGYTSAGPLRVHGEVHLERRLSAATDPCAAPDGFSELDVTFEYQFEETSIPATIVASRCPGELYSGPPTTTDPCIAVTPFTGVLLDGTDDDVGVIFTDCSLEGPAGMATLTGAITIGPCEVVHTGGP